MLVTKTRIDFGMPQTSPLNSDPIAALPASNPFRARYTKIAPLSSGSFGFVILYSNNVTKEHIAIKFLERGKAGLDKHYNNKHKQVEHVQPWCALDGKPVLACGGPHTPHVPCILDGQNSRVNYAVLLSGENITKYVEGEILNHRVLRHPHVIEFKVL